MNSPWRPTPEQIAAAQDGTIPDVIGPGLQILFSGINPSLYSAAVGHHFARPGNRFWPTLHSAGFTHRRFDPFEDQGLIDLGLGITNVVARATGAADELSAEELTEGGRLLDRKIQHYRPKILALLGITAYRSAYHRPQARMGLQAELISGSRLWVLPNPSGRNGHFSVEPFLELRRALSGGDLAPEEYPR
ncbi:G/U mismatch-specific DNA glycosylase [Tundrisphaera lichenicola]|uniref:G/U mismatch-specific DNA glycosylase n=1 Tax=Tundrisphaera lichenicola TaxID=2029860 RepID=UPI003EBC5FF3